MISQNLTDELKRRCYITDNNELTLKRFDDTIKDSLTKVKRLIGLENATFDFEAKGNEEELELFKNYVWYAWNDSSHEFKDNYLDDINSLHHKWEVKQYAEKELT